MTADDDGTSLSRACALIEKWSSISPRHCLDIRSPEDYAKAHLIPSTNIPFPSLESSFSQLPPKFSGTSFLLITPPHTYFRGLPIGGLLSLRGWRLDGVIEVPTDDSANSIWSHVEKLQILGTGEEGTELMFRPSPVLGEWIDFIEQSLLLKQTLTMVDIGCGSGRDMGFLISRPRGWHVIGLDSWQKSLVRAQSLVKSINPSPHLSTFLHAEILDDGTILPLSPSQLVKDVDLVVISRFFRRELFRRLHEYIARGGFLVFSHFTEGLGPGGKEYETPPREKRVRRGEVEEILGGIEGWEVLQAKDASSEDGRPMWDVVARWSGKSFLETD